MLRIVLLLATLLLSSDGFTAPVALRNPSRQKSGVLTMSSENPTTFREAEVLGLKLMQEEKYEDALKGNVNTTDISMIVSHVMIYIYTKRFRKA